jgi:hypothetical protein
MVLGRSKKSTCGGGCGNFREASLPTKQIKKSYFRFPAANFFNGVAEISPKILTEEEEFSLSLAS